MRSNDLSAPMVLRLYIKCSVVVGPSAVYIFSMKCCEDRWQRVKIISVYSRQGGGFAQGLMVITKPPPAPAPPRTETLVLSCFAAQTNLVRGSASSGITIASVPGRWGLLLVKVCVDS